MYFTALLARTEDGWEASDTEFDDVESLDDLAELARDAATDDEPVLVCIEQEGAWFGIVRVDGEEDPRVFVSDAARAMRSAYGEILLSDELLGRQPEDPFALEQLTSLDGTEDGTEDRTPQDGEADVPSTTAGTGGGDALTEDPEAVPAGPLGDPGLMSDVGIEPLAVLRLAPKDALGEIADALGCAEVLEAVR